MTSAVPATLVDAFERDGYVVVPGLLPVDELDAFADQVNEAVQARKAADTRPLERKSRYEQSFIQCQNLWEDFPSVRRLTFHPRIAQAAAELLRADAVRLWHDQALYKEPGGRETDPHQDQPYWPIAEERTVTAWIPFAGATLQDGCMGYVPGSHKLGVRKFVNIFTGTDDSIREETQDLLRVEPVYAEVPKGSIAFHHGLTAHLARPNRTASVRAVHTVIYFADGCTRAARGGHPSVDRSGIEPGAVIDGAMTPVAWPRPNGDLPPPPPPDTTSPEAYRRIGLTPGAPRGS